jgi:fatty acid amide hydrolase
MSACEIVSNVSQGNVSAKAVVDACIQRIEQTHVLLHAMVVPLFEQARTEAAAIDAARQRGEPLGPLAGLPFTVKESFDVAGTPTTLGLTARAGHKAETDAHHVARLRQAGAILLGKTNVSLLVMGNESANPLYGRTNNPWNPDRAPGGSSGGEAALIAAGGSPLGLGTDIGGSVRLPANACGIHAIKPTSNRLPMPGNTPLYAGQEAIVVQPGPLARHVADLDLAIRFLCSETQPGLPPPVSTKGIRVAFYTDNGILSAAPALQRAVREAATALEARGVHVEEWQPPEMPEAWSAYLGILMADGSASARRMAEKSALTPSIRRIFLSGAFPRWLLAGTAAPLLNGIGQRHMGRVMRGMGHISANRYWLLLDWRTQYRRRFLQALKRGGFHAILCPPDALPALPHGHADYLADALSYSAVYNLLGMPAGVVAATRVQPGEETVRPRSADWVERSARQAEDNSTGLPVGVQVVAHHWREDIVLALMHVLEEHFRASPSYPIWRTPVSGTMIT